MEDAGLWSKNFRIITLGTFVSIVGCASMNLALSLLILDQTSSTWMTGIYAVTSLIPNAVVPFFLAPVIDRCDPKKMIVAIDFGTGILYLIFLCYIWLAGFRYEVYLMFGFVVGSGDAVYDLAYQSLYPELIPTGYSQKGFSISAILPPLATAIIAPIVAGIYASLGIEIVFLAEGILLLVAAAFETQIDFQKNTKRTEKTVSQWISDYKKDLIYGISYLKEEKGIRNICIYMAFTNAALKGKNMMIMAFFQTGGVFTTTMYALLVSAETAGRFVGGVFHYFLKIPREKRYNIAAGIGTVMEICDGLLLFLSYPLMICLRFLSGFVGVNSDTLRQASVQSHLPSDTRARINGLLNMVSALAMMIVQLIAGAIGEFISYSYIVVGFSSLSFLCLLLTIIRNHAEVSKIYYWDY